MGLVVLAYDAELDRNVALKLVKSSAWRRAGKAGRERLKREAQAMARLSHPNVVSVHDVGSYGDRLFIAMEYVPGCNLKQWLRIKQRGWREILDVLRKAGQGLAAVHSAGFIHRDFKPENVLVADDGRVLVGDFGLVHAGRDVWQSSSGESAEESLESAASNVADAAGPETMTASGMHAFEREQPTGVSADESPVADGELEEEWDDLGESSTELDIALSSEEIAIGDTLAVAPVTMAKSQPEPSAELAPEEALSARITTPLGGWTLTATGALLGTPAYMSPEQFRGDTLDARADQFAFAVTLYEALYRTRPFTGASPIQIFDAIVDGAVALPKKRGGVPGWVDGVVRRGMAASADDRFPSLDVMLERLRPESRRRRRVVASVILGVALAAGAGAVTSQLVAENRTQNPCRRVAERLDAVWGEQQQEALGRAFSSTGLPYAAAAASGVTASLTRYGDDWAAMRVEACEAAQVRREESAELYDLRMVCLDRRLDELGELVTVLSGEVSQEMVKRGVEAVEGLVEIERCADSEALRSVAPPPKAVAERVGEARHLLTRYRARWMAGRYEETLEQLWSKLAEFRALDYPPLVAEAELLHARLLEAAGSFKEVLPVASEAIVQAGLAGDDYVHAEALLLTVTILNLHLAKPGEAERLLPATRAAVARLPGAHTLLAGYHNNAGNVHLLLKRIPEARREYQVAIEILEGAEDAPAMQLASIYGNAGEAARISGELETARTYHVGALELSMAKLGADHPHTALRVLQVANVDYTLGDLRAAEENYRRALAGLEKTVGSQHPYVGMLSNNLGDTMQRAGRWEEAAKSYERAVAILTVTNGAEHPYTLQAVTGLANAELERGPGQLAAARAALETARAALGPDSDPDLRARLELAEAKFLWQEGRRQEARRRAEAVRSGLLERQSGAGDVALVEAWLDRHGVPAR